METVPFKNSNGAHRYPQVTRPSDFLFSVVRGESHRSRKRQLDLKVGLLKELPQESISMEDQRLVISKFCFPQFPFLKVSPLTLQACE